MVLLEVYVQGVSRFLAPFKFPLAKGYNVVYGGNETGKTALAQALAATFDGNHASQVAPRLQPVVQPEGALRYGALFEHNGHRYRLLRDLSGGLNLARMNAATQKFELLAKDEQALSNFLQDEIDFPLDGLFTLLGVIDRRLGGGPATAAPAEASFSSAPYDDGYGDYPDEGAGQTQDIEAQLKQLRRELSILSSVDDLEFKVDGLQKRKFETEAHLAKYKDLDARVEKIEKRQAAIQPIETLTPELEARVQNLQKTEEYQRQKLSSLDAEIHALEKQLDVLEPKAARKLHKDPFFIVGAVVTVLGFVLPFFTKEFLVLFGFAGGGWLAYLFFMVYPKLSAELDEINKKYKRLVAEEEKIKKDFDTATAVIRDLVKKLQVIDAKDLLQLAAEWREMQQEKVEIQAQRDAIASQAGTPEKVRKDLERQEAEIALFEEELRNAGAITRDANQIQAEIKRLEAVRDSGGNVSVASAMPAAASYSAPEAAGQPGIALGSLLEAAARLARVELDHVLSVGVDKMNTYIRALSGGKLGPAQIDAAGNLSLLRSEYGNRTFSLAELSDGARDTVLLAVRFGLLEMILPTRQFPVIFDDPFSLLDDQRQAVAGKALKRLSGVTQVIHFTSQKSFLALADNKVELK